MRLPVRGIWNQSFHNMVESFTAWLGAIGALCIGIMALAVFFALLNAVKDSLKKPQHIQIKGFLSEAELVTVHLTSGKVISGLKFVGVVDASTIKGNLPWQLTSMVVFETEDQRRVMVRGDSIKIMEAQKE